MKKSKPSRASRRAALSCSASCDKCGATDIYRRHRRAAERFNKDMGDYTTWENAHVRYDTYYAFAKCECIVHHCRTCGYEWATDIHKPNNALTNACKKDENGKEPAI